MYKFEELDNLIGMLEEELEWFRHRQNPDDNTDHKYYRMLLTLATAIKELTNKDSQE